MSPKIIIAKSGTSPIISSAKDKTRKISAYSIKFPCALCAANNSSLSPVPKLISVLNLCLTVKRARIIAKRLSAPA